LRATIFISLFQEYFMHNERLDYWNHHIAQKDTLMHIFLYTLANDPDASLQGYR